MKYAIKKRYSGSNFESVFFLQIFQPYAKQWLPVLTQLIISGNHGGEGLHYFVVDIIVTMLSWATTAILEVRGREYAYCTNMSDEPTVHCYMKIIKVHDITRLDENCIVMLERLEKEIYFKTD